MTTHETVTLDADGATTGGDDAPAGSRPAPRRGPGAPRLATLLSLLAVVVFAVVGIGAPLLGDGVFAPTDELSTRSPYLDAGLYGIPVQNIYLDDIYTAAIPNTELFADALRDGDAAAWNPYVSGGGPLGATPNYGVLNPLTAPYYLLPGWLAPAYVKLLEIACAVAGCFLFLRRLRLGRAAALIGGLVFASSAFMVVWTNWPQTRVAALIPWVFWAAERLVQRRRVSDAVVLCLPVAAMLFGGFPSVTAFTIYTAGAYLLVRAVAAYPGQWRRVVGLVAGAGAALAGAVALAAVQLVPFLSFYSSWLIEGRAQTPDRHLQMENLVTSIAPWAYGSTEPGRPPFFYLSGNLIENLSYVGAAALVLVLVAVAAVRTGRAALPRAAWLFFVVASGGWALLIYGGGVVLGIAQQLPVFSNNFVGRGRSVLGFLLAVLAAVGFELLIRRRLSRRDGVPAPRERWFAVAWAVAVWGGAAAVGALAVQRGRHAAFVADARYSAAVDRVAHLDRQLVLGGAFVAAALACAALGWWGTRRGGGGRRAARLGAAVLLPVLVASQALTLVVPFYPRVDRATYYPTTDVHRYLADHLGHERFAGTFNAMFMGVDSAKRLRALTGHSFLNARFATMVRGVPGDPVPYPTYLNLRADPRQAASPVLDRLGVRYFVTSPRDPVFGVVRTTADDGTAVTLEPGRPVAVRVPGTGPVRAVGLAPTTGYPEAAAATAHVQVSLRDPSGREVATASKLALAFRPGAPWMIPVSTEGTDDAAGVPAGTPLTAVVTLRGREPLTVRAAGGVPAVSAVAPAADGLRLVHAGSSVVYQRTTAMPRIRWASGAVVEPDPAKRVGLLAGDTVGGRTLTDAEVVLDSAEDAAGGDGQPAVVEVEEDGLDAVRATVDADGAGYLVVADAMQVGWEVTVDGRPATLVPADEGVVAVAVPAGRHTVALHYRAPRNGLGTWLTGATLAVLVALVAGDWWWERRRGGRAANRDRRDRISSPGPPATATHRHRERS